MAIKGFGDEMLAIHPAGEKHRKEKNDTFQMDLSHIGFSIFRRIVSGISGKYSRCISVLSALILSGESDGFHTNSRGLPHKQKTYHRKGIFLVLLSLLPV
jgi:hypothetical protein